MVTLGMDAGNGIRIGKMLIGEDGKLGFGVGENRSTWMASIWIASCCLENGWGS